MDLTRTREALAAFDAAAARLDALGSEADEATIDEAIEKHDDARAALGEAFAADTSDRNDEDTAKGTPDYPAGLAFIRRLCAEEG